MPHISLGPISLDVPAGWSLTTLILAGPVDEQSGAGARERFPSRPFQQNLVAAMERVEDIETAESYVLRQIDGLRKAQVPRWEKAEPKQVSLPDGATGLLTEQVVIGPGNERVRQMQLVTIKQHVAYTLIATHKDGESFEEAREDFKRMLLSFHIS